MRRRGLLGANAGGLGLFAGCPGSPTSNGGGRTPTTVRESPPTESPSSAPEGTPRRHRRTVGQRRRPIPPRRFPTGRRDRRSAQKLTPETVESFAKSFEYCSVYNARWDGQSTEVHADCEVRRSESVDPGYRVTVSCTAYSNAGGEPRETGSGTTTVVHADHFTQPFVSVVTADSISHRRAED